MSMNFDVFGSLENAGCYRSGPLVVLPAGGELPLRCVVCNEPCEGRTTIKVVQRSEVATVLMFLAPLIGVLLFLFGGKRLKVQAGLCPRHVRKRSLYHGMVTASLVVSALLFLSLVVADVHEIWGGLVTLAVVLLILAAIFGRLSRVARLSHVDLRNTYLICGQPFLASLSYPAAQAVPYNQGYANYSGQMAPPGYGMPMYGPGWLIPPQRGFGGY